MKGTSAWRSAWRQPSVREPVALVRITPTTGQTLFLATKNTVTPDGQYWNGLLLDGSVSARMDFGSTDVTLASMNFDAVDAAVGASGKQPIKLSAQLASAQYIGAEVVLWLWSSVLTSFDDALQRYVGTLQTYSTRMQSVSFTALQKRDWNRVVALRFVGKTEFPFASEDAYGAALPVLLGAVQPPPTRPSLGLPEYGSVHYQRTKMAGASRGARAVVVDVGNADENAKLKVIVAGHKCDAVGASAPMDVVVPSNNGPFGTSFLFSPDGQSTHVCVPDGYFNAQDGAGFFLDLKTPSMWAPCSPVDAYGERRQIDPHTPPPLFVGAENARLVLDPYNDNGIASLTATPDVRRNRTSPSLVLNLRFPSMTEHGPLNAAWLSVVYRSSANLSGCEVGRRAGYGEAYVSRAALPASTGWSVYNLDLTATAFPAYPATWDMSGDTFFVRFLNFNCIGWVDVIAAALTFNYAPKLDVVSQSRVYVDRNIPRGQSETNTQSTKLINLSTTKGQFFCNARGYVDTSLGRYTGEPEALVDLAPDVVHLVLGEFGKVPISQVRFASGEVGDFFNARALCMTERNTPMKLAMAVSEEMNVRDVLNFLASSCLAQVRPSEFDNKWTFLPWLLNPTITYTAPVGAQDILSPEEGVSVDMLPDSAVLSGVKVQYGYDAVGQKYLHETTLRSDSSIGGYANFNLRDGAPFVVVQDNNDRIEWSANHYAYRQFSVVLDAGAYTALELGQAVASKMNDVEAAAGRNARYACAMTGTVIAGMNDVFRFSLLGTTYSVSVAAGEYAPSELAVLLTAALNAVPVTQNSWLVTYDEVAHKFFVRCARITIGTVDPVFVYPSIVFPSPSDTSADGWTSLGFENGFTSSNLGSMATAPILLTQAGRTADYARAPDFFFIAGRNTAMRMLWRSGGNGSLGTKWNAGELLGFDPKRDSEMQCSYQGDCARVPREEVLAASDAAFGKKAPYAVDGRALYDDATALTLRNRLADLKGAPRPIVKFSTEVHADMELGDVFVFDSSMDSLQPCPAPMSNGTWLERPMQVLEAHQSFGSSWHTEIVAVDVSSS